MIKVIGVRFRTAGKIYFFDPADYDIKKGDHVIVETARGIEFGTVVGGIRQVADDEVIQPLKPVLRIATERDIEQEADNKRREKEAYKLCLEKIREHGLDMKLIDAEYTFDNNKVLFYFTSDGRIDFRELVKDLAAIFKTRIELRQIGVRDETKMVGGIGMCGRPLCCYTHLADFIPVSIKMAKEQNLSLNPTKISGVCGRLMCCLKHEEETYEALNKNLPHIGDRVTCPDGAQGEVSSVNVLRQLVKIVVEKGDSKEICEYKVEDIQFVRKGHRQNRAEVSAEELRALELMEKQDKLENKDSDGKSGDSRKERKSRGDREDRPERGEREERRERGDREERRNRKERRERENREERGEISEQGNHREERVENADRKDRESREERPENGERRERSNREERRERGDREERRNRKERRERENREERTDNGVQEERVENADRKDREGREERPENGERRERGSREERRRRERDNRRNGREQEMKADMEAAEEVSTLANPVAEGENKETAGIRKDRGNRRRRFDKKDRERGEQESGEEITKQNNHNAQKNKPEHAPQSQGEKLQQRGGNAPQDAGEQSISQRANGENVDYNRRRNHFNRNRRRTRAEGAQEQHES